MKTFWNKNVSAELHSNHPFSRGASATPVEHLIIGAGLTGASLGYWLKKKYSDQTVVLVDAQFAGYGASGRNAGFLTSGSLLHVEKMIGSYGEEFAKERLLTTRSIRNYFHRQGWIEPHEKVGSLTLCSEKVSLGRAVELYEKMNWKLDHREFKPFRWALFDDSEFSINPIELLNNILSASQCQLVEGLTVQNVGRDDAQNSWKVTAHSHADTHSFLARSVYVCTHTRMRELLPELGAHYSPSLNMIGLTQPFDHGIKQNTYIPELLCYFKPISDSQIVIGGLREKTGTLSERINRYISPLMRWGNVQLQEEWSGEIGLTEQPQPLAYARGDGLFALGCYSGHGVALSFGAAYGFVRRIDSLTSNPQKFEVFTGPTLEYPT